MRRVSSSSFALWLAATALFPLSALAAQKKSAPPPPPNASPVYQGTELRESTDNLYNRKLTPVAEAMRNDVILVRDTLDVVAAYAERVHRAAASNTQSVMLSATKTLAPACAAGARILAVVRPRMEAIHLKVEDHSEQLLSEGMLKDYRASMQSLEAVLVSCETQSAELLRAKTPNNAQFEKLAAAVSIAELNYEGHLRVTLTHFDIPLRPKDGKSR